MYAILLNGRSINKETKMSFTAEDSLTCCASVSDWNVTYQLLL